MFKNEMKSNGSTATAIVSHPYIINSDVDGSLQFASRSIPNTQQHHNHQAASDHEWMLPSESTQNYHHHHHHHSIWDIHHGGYLPHQQQQQPHSPTMQVPPTRLAKLRGCQMPPLNDRVNSAKSLLDDDKEIKGSGKRTAPEALGAVEPLVVGSSRSCSSAKRCRVCGDRAVNHNFGQLTCESCKAFFRRNAHKELTCTSKSGEHVVSTTTRRECPACRLKRCFLIGMRPDLIQVRKKDGTKPRWLDKYPAAAQIHENQPTHSEAPDSLNIQQNSNSGLSGSRILRDQPPRPYQYHRFTDHQFPPANSQLMGSVGDHFEQKNVENYRFPLEVIGTTPCDVAAPPMLQTTNPMFDESGPGLGESTALLRDEIDSPYIKSDFTGPRYRSLEGAGLRDYLTDENSHHKRSSWVPSLDSSNDFLPNHWLHQNLPFIAHDGEILEEGLGTESSLLANFQPQNNEACHDTDTYTALQQVENRSGASSGSATSPSISSVPTNFGSGNSDTLQTSVESAALKTVKFDWLTVKKEQNEVVRHSSSTRRTRTFDAISSEIRRPILSPVEADIWLPRLYAAWKWAWLDGVFPNPSEVSLHLDLDQPSQEWRLVLANLWSDLLLRRVASFASSLFIFHGEYPLNFPLPRSLLLWIFKNRLVNCVPILLARALLRPAHSTNGTTPTGFPLSEQPRQRHVEGGGSSPCSPRQSRVPSPMSLSTKKCFLEDSSVCFHVLPQQRVFISLSKLNAKLEEHCSSTYPMLQYLEAYVCELNKFLTEQTILLAAYMAIKLTETPTTKELLQNPLLDADLHLMNRLNRNFLQLFGLATDHVASSIVNGDLEDSRQRRVVAMNDAISRRTKLPDFLSWGRQFDDNMKTFLFETCYFNRQQRQYLGGKQPFISHGLDAFCSETTQFLNLFMPIPTFDESSNAL